MSTIVVTVSRTATVLLRTKRPLLNSAKNCIKQQVHGSYPGSLSCPAYFPVTGFQLLLLGLCFQQSLAEIRF